MLAARVLALEAVARAWSRVMLRGVYSNAGTSLPAAASNCEASHDSTSAIRAASSKLVVLVFFDSGEMRSFMSKFSISRSK